MRSSCVLRTKMDTVSQHTSPPSLSAEEDVGTNTLFAFVFKWQPDNRTTRKYLQYEVHGNTGALSLRIMYAFGTLRPAAAQFP